MTSVTTKLIFCWIDFISQCKPLGQSSTPPKKTLFQLIIPCVLILVGTYLTLICAPCSPDVSTQPSTSSSTPSCRTAASAPSSSTIITNTLTNKQNLAMGGSVIRSWTSAIGVEKACVNPWSRLSARQPEDSYTTNITTLLHSSAFPTEQWCFVGPTGHISIALSTPGFLSHIIIGSGSQPALAFTQRYSAPREIILWGLVDGKTNLRRTSILSSLQSVTKDAHQFTPIVQFEFPYRAYHSATQAIDCRLLKEQIDFGVVVLEVRSNWGSRKTCLTTIEVYGEAIQI